ncbi:hypothetical protein OJ253_776 [Cryptosporidium canis]|uniref:Uncharacterized protein n=1 Tax=Cryptosporidium canis TaxID=195482 RepID=A0A9D5DLG4_9CRYT|nr:hypothetical protein OJ253_776 [Cryptosporidium canis]
MYIEAHKRTGPVELELVGDIPRTERLDTDIISPTSYDDVFEVIPTYRGARSKSELRMDMPEDLKARMCEVLRFCGVSEFDREDSSQLERSSRGLRSVRPLKTHSLGPPFLIRLMRYNILERKSPSYFDFGVNLTLPTSCLVSEHRLLRTVHPRDNPWYKGCRRLIVVGVPSSLLSGDIAEMFLSFSKKLSLHQRMWDCEAPAGELKSSSKQFFSLMELGIKRFTNLFTTENRDHYLNILYRPCGAFDKYHTSISLLEFQEEEEALNLWVALSAGLFQCYGSVLTAIPDPLGRRVFAEGMLTVFSPKNIPLQDSVEQNAKEILKKDFTASGKTELILHFPLVGSPRSLETTRRQITKVFRDLPEADKAEAYTMEEAFDCLTVRLRTKRAAELANNRLFQHCTFRQVSEPDGESLSDYKIQIVNTAMFVFGDKLCEPVIIEGDFDIHTIKHRTMEPGATDSGHEKNSRISFSSLSQGEQDTEPVGFLFKKFEELREALQHGLGPGSANSEEQNANSAPNISSIARGMPKTPPEMVIVGEPNAPKTPSNPVNMISRRTSGPQVGGSYREERESYAHESPDSYHRRPNHRRRSHDYYDDYMGSPRDPHYPHRRPSEYRRDYSRRPEYGRPGRPTGKRKASAELPRKNAKSSSYRREPR